MMRHEIEWSMLLSLLKSPDMFESDVCFRSAVVVTRDGCLVDD